MGIFKKAQLAKLKQRSAPDRTHGILLVDDEQANLQTLTSALQRKYQVYNARDGEEALKMVQQPGFADKVQLILSDQRMPRLTGVQFFEKIIDIAPNTIRILVTGYADVDAIIASINKAKIYKFILKPVDHQLLQMTVERALEAYDLRKEVDEYHRELENKVRQRTRELEEANDKLRATNRELEVANDRIRQEHAKLLRAQDQLIMQQKMAFLGTLTAGIAHELRNPLNFIINFSETASHMIDEVMTPHSAFLDNVTIPDDDDPETLAEWIQQIDQNIQLVYSHGQRANGVIKMMLRFSESKITPKEPTDLNQLVSSYIDLAHHSGSLRFPDIKVLLEKDLDDSVGTVSVSHTGMMHVLTNMCNNSFESIASKRESNQLPGYVPMIKVQTRNADDHVEIRLFDNGMGMDVTTRGQVFHPFFTTKSNPKNIGLGLAIAYDIIVQEHGGAVDVSADEDEHSEFVIRIPIS